MQNVEILIEKKNQLNSTSLEELEESTQLEETEEIIIKKKFKELLYRNRDKRVDIFLDDNLLDDEDIIRKYSRKTVFWFFCEKYLKTDHKDIGDDNLNIIKEIIRDEYQKELDNISNIFNKNLDLKLTILSRIEEYKWKDENYGNSRKNPTKFLNFNLI